MKSASSLLEALIGGVAVAVGLAELPEVAYLTPAKRVPNQAMASYCSCQFRNRFKALANAIEGVTNVVAADLLAGNGVVSDTSHCEL